MIRILTIQTLLSLFLLLIICIWTFVQCVSMCEYSMSLFMTFCHWFLLLWSVKLISRIISGFFFKVPIPNLPSKHIRVQLLVIIVRSLSMRAIFDTLCGYIIINLACILIKLVDDSLDNSFSGSELILLDQFQNLNFDFIRVWLQRLDN